MSLEYSIIKKMGRIAQWHAITKMKVRRTRPPGALPNEAYHPAGGDISGDRLGVGPSLRVLALILLDARRQVNAVTGPTYIPTANGPPFSF